MYGRGPVVNLPHTKAVLLERARRIRIAAMRAKHEVAIIKGGGFVGPRGVLPAYKTLEARANAWEVKADRLMREAAKMEEDAHREIVTADRQENTMKSNT